METLVWLPEALEDLKRLHAFIATHNIEAANRAMGLLVKSAKSLQELPEKGRPWEPDLDYRELTVRFAAKGYVIRYRLWKNSVVIVRIWHGLEER